MYSIENARLLHALVNEYGVEETIREMINILDAKIDVGDKTMRDTYRGQREVLCDAVGELMRME